MEGKSFMNHLENLVITVFPVNLCIVITPLVDIALEAEQKWSKAIKGLPQYKV